MSSLQRDNIIEIRGPLQRIDPASRQVEVLVQGTVRVVDVPTACGVFLNGERVKLRLLQPLDRAHLICAPGEGTWIAESIRVSTWAHSGER
jgi:hypothetical protein